MTDDAYLELLIINNIVTVTERYMKVSTAKKYVSARFVSDIITIVTQKSTFKVSNLKMSAADVKVTFQR